MDTTNQNYGDSIRSRMSPKDFFLQMAAIVTLYVSASSLLALLFQIINLSFPDALQSRYYYSDPYSAGIRFAIASLIIIFPLYIFLTRFLNKEYAANTEKRNLGIRKWLMYFTLFVTGAVIVGDLIALLNTFLGGEITVRFILKILAVFAVAALIFGYYLKDLRSVDVLPKGERAFFQWIAIVFVAASIIGGFAIMGSPQKQRFIRFDNQKVNDLQNIQGQIVSYWQQKGELPNNLESLGDSIGGYKAPVDPQTRASYEYSKTNNLSFVLCADFNFESVDKNNSGSVLKIIMDPYGQNENWQHEKGRQCFDRTIDPQRYPIFEKGAR